MALGRCSRNGFREGRENRRLASSPPNQSSILILIGSVGIESLKPSLSQREKKSAIVELDDSQSCTYRALIKKAEAVLPKGAHGSDSAHDISETSQGKRKPGRAVLVIVTEWPSGTMAMSFGSAMKRALRLTQDEMRVVQMSPERIFRASTDVTEGEFRESMSKSGSVMPRKGSLRRALKFTECPSSKAFVPFGSIEEVRRCVGDHFGRRSSSSKRLPWHPGGPSGFLSSAFATCKRRAFIRSRRMRS